MSARGEGLLQPWRSSRSGHLLFPKNFFRRVLTGKILLLRKTPRTIQKPKLTVDLVLRGMVEIGSCDFMAEGWPKESRFSIFSKKIPYSHKGSQTREHFEPLHFIIHQFMSATSAMELKILMVAFMKQWTRRSSWWQSWSVNA